MATSGKIDKGFSVYVIKCAICKNVEQLLAKDLRSAEHRFRRGIHPWTKKRGFGWVCHDCCASRPIKVHIIYKRCLQGQRQSEAFKDD